MNYNKVLVVGLDGACWDLIEEWIEMGELPNIKKLRENGVWGKLKSSIPPITCPAWKCFSTGKNPGKLGVYWWNEIDMDKKEVRPASAKKFKSKEIWDYLNEQGIKTGIIGMPLTYPPKEVNGFMISGGPTCELNGYTYPFELQGFIEKKYDFRPHPKLVSSLKKDSGLTEEIIRKIKLNFEVFEGLIENSKIHFGLVTTFYLNWLQHYFYQGEPTKRAWKILDGEIGKLKEKFTYIILVSDHGTSPMNKNFYINAWLKKEGYLSMKRDFRSLLLRLGLNRDNIANLLEKLNLLGLLSRSRIIKRIGEKIPDSQGRLSDRAGNEFIKKINWKNSKVIGLPQGPIYIKKENLLLAEYEKLRNEISQKLEQLKDPENREKIFRGVYKPEKIYWGKYLDSAPDLIALDSDRYHNRGGILKNELFEKSEWKGNNARYGLFSINGPGIRKGEFIEGVRIFDLAPTILYLMGCEIPKDMDGKVLREIFEDKSESAKHAVRYIDTKRENIRKKVKELKHRRRI